MIFHAEDDFALIGLSRNDGSVATEVPRRVGEGIKLQVGLLRLLVWPVAVVAVVAEDGPDVAFEADGWFSNRG
ncbi:MAG: hypothetical protein AAF191_18075, partial [Verrucomicrobiota bacterium]